MVSFEIGNFYHQVPYQDFRSGFHHLDFGFRLGADLAFGSGADSSPGACACAFALGAFFAPGWAAFFISARISLGRAERVPKIPGHSVTYRVKSGSTCSEKSCFPSPEKCSLDT